MTDCAAKNNRLTFERREKRIPLSLRCFSGRREAWRPQASYNVTRRVSLKERLIRSDINMTICSKFARSTCMSRPRGLLFLAWKIQLKWKKGWRHLRPGAGDGGDEETRLLSGWDFSSGSSVTAKKERCSSEREEKPISTDIISISSRGTSRHEKIPFRRHRDERELYILYTPSARTNVLIYQERTDGLLQSAIIDEGLASPICSIDNVYLSASAYILRTFIPLWTKTKSLK